MPASYTDYNKLQVEWGNQDKYDVSQKIRHSKYSEVYVGMNVETNKGGD